MKCLSVHQGWAWAIIHGPKRVENRTWATKHRGPILIHASKSLASWNASIRRIPGLPAVENLPFGAIVGRVEVRDCLPWRVVRDRPFAEGPWCWILADPEPIGPIPYAGMPGLFEVPWPLGS